MLQILNWNSVDISKHISNIAHESTNIIREIELCLAISLCLGALYIHYGKEKHGSHRNSQLSVSFAYNLARRPLLSINRRP